MSSVLNSLTRLSAQSAGRLGAVTTLYFFLTTMLAVVEGIILVKIINPGSYAGPPARGPPASCPATPVDSILDLVRNLFPKNIVQATFQTTKTCLSYTVLNASQNITEEMMDVGMQNGMNILGLVCLAILFGIVISSLGEEGKPLADFFYALEAATMKLVTWVIWYVSSSALSKLHN